ncbi:predicted protein [Naegleria gruberi]|uniref:Predicted protein n=1 Tax=Naegleria gruberi TaxID=5762 RepID=D2W2Z2_NAEGR|nr:uncharacterized protein NAEGRDRAFT_54306 [Naegleria gruberi]EFC36490.1 predicted protein [Naegleria gruberi]|eukprot:XP_002669234.1 predicted protein [Naegleria gruberi strain NEG-M]
MQTIRLVIGSSSLGTFNNNGTKSIRNLSQDFKSSEGLLESFETLKQALEVFLRNQISNNVEDERSDLKNFRISFVIKSKFNKKPSPLRNESDFSRLVELVKKVEEAQMLVIRMDLKKKNKLIRNKRNLEKDEEIEAKKNQIKSLQNEIESKRQELKNLTLELKDLYNTKKSEDQLVGLMNKISLDQPSKPYNSTHNSKKIKYKK